MLLICWLAARRVFPHRKEISRAHPTRCVRDVAVNVVVVLLAASVVVIRRHFISIIYCTGLVNVQYSADGKLHVIEFDMFDEFEKNCTRIDFKLGIFIAISAE